MINPMPSNLDLDLDRMKAAHARLLADAINCNAGYINGKDVSRYGESDKADDCADILNAAPDLIAEVERLTQELATAKAVGAAEDAIIFVPTGERKWQFQAMEYFLTEEGNIAYFNQPTDWPYTKDNPRPIYKMERAAEIRKGIK